MIFFRFSAPSLCPSLGSRFLSFAHLLFPSIIIAICFGIMFSSILSHSFYIFIISFSLFSNSLSISSVFLSVNFCICSSSLFKSSSVISEFFCNSFASSIASLLIERIAILASSANFLISFTNSFLLSSFNSGNASLITFPSLFGFIPISAANIAFSISFNKFVSHGWITINLASGTDIPATWFIGVQPWDTNLLKEIEKAILAADIGIN